MACIFCKTVRGEMPCLKLAETATSIAFLDVNPLSRGHCLVIPKHHAAKLHELPAESVSDCALLMHRVAGALGVENYNILQNNGKLAHQAVFHVHFHIIPKTARNDGLGIGWDQMEVGCDMAQLKQVAEAIVLRINANATTTTSATTSDNSNSGGAAAAK